MTRKTTVANIIQLMEKIAPLDLAEEWDNCGLQIGYENLGIKKIWIALDPSLAVIENAVSHHVNLIISHHPLIMKPLRFIDLSSNLGKNISLCIENQIAIYSAHTNLDSVFGGVNDILAEKIGLKNCSPLDKGHPKKITDVAINGLGRVGYPETHISLIQFAEDIKKRLNIPHIRVSGKLDLTVEKVALCSGSGSSLLPSFYLSGAQVFISGDLKYHDARDAQERGVALIDIGHFASESIFIESLAKRLQQEIQNKNLDAIVEPCKLETEPFLVL